MNFTSGTYYTRSSKYVFELVLSDQSPVDTVDEREQMPNEHNISKPMGTPIAHLVEHMLQTRMSLSCSSTDSNPDAMMHVIPSLSPSLPVSLLSVSNEAEMSKNINIKTCLSYIFYTAHVCYRVHNVSQSDECFFSLNSPKRGGIGKWEVCYFWHSL